MLPVLKDSNVFIHVETKQVTGGMSVLNCKAQSNILSKRIQNTYFLSK